jgi:hypothetical protein
MKIINKFSQNVANLTYLGAIEPADELNCIDNEIKSGLNSGTR